MKEQTGKFLNMLLYVVFLLTFFVLLQCKSYEPQVIEGDKSWKIFQPTLMIDSCIVERQYEGKTSTDLTRVYVNGGNKSIPQWAFAVVPSLEDVRLSPDIQSIGDNAFFSCKKLARINLENVDTIGENSFKNTALENINLSRAKIIKEFAFANCTLLHRIKFSDNLDSIEDFAFSGDTALVSCHLPAGCIGTGAFMGCSMLKEVFLGNVLIIGDAAFLDCKSLTHVVIPASVKSIGNDAFAGCINLKDATICGKETKIAENAFEKNVIISKKYEKL